MHQLVNTDKYKALFLDHSRFVKKKNNSIYLYMHYVRKIYKSERGLINISSFSEKSSS